MTKLTPIVVPFTLAEIHIRFERIAAAGSSSGLPQLQVAIWNRTGEHLNVLNLEYLTQREVQVDEAKATPADGGGFLQTVWKKRRLHIEDLGHRGRFVTNVDVPEIEGAANFLFSVYKMDGRRVNDIAFERSPVRVLFFDEAGEARSIYRPSVRPNALGEKSTLRSAAPL